MCMRNYRGFEYNAGYPVCELSLEQFKHIVTPNLLQQLMQPEPAVGSFQPVLHIKRGVTFNGNLGDFASARDAVEIVEYLVEHDVPVEINTNGSLRNTRWWSRLAHPNVVVGFALDGLEDTHKLYRQDTDWHKIVENAQALIAAGGRAWWRFIPFDHNRHQEEECRQLARKLGFEKFENIYDGRDNGPVFDRTGEFSHQIGHDTRPAEVVPDIKPLLESHITWYSPKTFRHPRDTEQLDMQCNHKRNREIYIAANGSVYPCCYLGFYPHSMNHPGNRELAPMVQENNALEYPLEHCLAWFDQIEHSWQKASVAEGRTYQCIATCNRNSNDIR